MTATERWFLAAARTMAGPPMSICSTHSSGVAPDATVASNGYRLDTSSWNGSMSELGQLGLVRREGQVGQQARVHPRVQGLDPAVQALGEPGQLLHPVTGLPAAVIRAAVPVETISTPAACSPEARSSSPVLS